MLRVALTGNYGMGKSTVLGEFAALGAATISADAIVNEMLGEPEILARIREVLGPIAFMPDGSLDRQRTARLIFMDNQKRRQYEALMHPIVFERMEARIGQAARDGASLAVAEVPLLYEGGYQGRFDKCITVYADFSTVVRRLKARGVKRDDIVVRHGAQMPVGTKIGRSDFCIDNNGSADETRAQVASIHALLSRVNGSQGA